MNIKSFFKVSFLVLLLYVLAVFLVPPGWITGEWRHYYHIIFGETSYQKPPESKDVSVESMQSFCDEQNEFWRNEQRIDGIKIQSSPICNPDNPYVVAASVKGTNNVSKKTLMKSGLAPDAVTKSNDRDGDGDPDDIHIRLEVAELNGRALDTSAVIPQYEIAPGIKPGFWVFTPKLRGMATKGIEDLRATNNLRAPSPPIRVEQGDRVKVTLQNTHYMPHTIHLHGVDHSFVDKNGKGNDGVPQVSEEPVMPGKKRTYEFKAREPGSMFYHCHVQPQAHVLMGLQGLFIVEEEQSNNKVQTFNLGAGRVRHPSEGVTETYDREYDLHYQDVDRELHEIVQESNDPRLIAEEMNRVYDATDRVPDYYLFNGRSFPYTFRESPIVVKPDQDVKLRVINGGHEGVSLHTHGHKFRITHYDGVKQNRPAQITRDVAWVSAAQRIDLSLQTRNDGLHSYGDGIWFLHDHRESAVTTDGQAPGGDISAIVYESYLGPNGWPETQGVDLSKYFMAKYYEREIPIWHSFPQLVDPTKQARQPLYWLVIGLFVGILVGVFVMGRRIL